MASPPEAVRQMTRGLLTDGERAFLRGDKDDVDEDTYRYNVRSRFRDRMEALETDLELLEDAGEDDLVNEFHQTFSRLEQLEREVQRLRDEVDQ